MALKNNKKKCLYCKRVFKPIRNQKITCGREACLKKHDREYHRAYFKTEDFKVYRREYIKEYSQRPEVKKSIQEYKRKYYKRKKAELSLS